MEENVQELLKDKNEDVVQFNFENNTSSPVAIDLFDTASLTTIPTSGTQQTTYTPSNDLLPSLPTSFLQLNPTNGIIMAGQINNNTYRVINSINNSTQNTFDSSNGFDGAIGSIVLQPDGKMLIGGAFTTYKGLTENRIIRLNSDGSKDLTFDNSIGFNNAVTSIVLQPDGKIICGGAFGFYKGVICQGIIRLNTDGSKDLTFDNSNGFNNNVNSIALQPDGKILVGGDFTQYKGLTENRIIRLNTDGTKDLTFDNSIGFFGQVFSVQLQSDGKIVVGGTFSQYKGLTENRIIRLNSDGSKDLTFDNSIGFDSNVNSIAIQPDGKILCGGTFTSYKGVSANRIIRLNSDGSKDLTFDNSIGFNNAVNIIVLQPDGKILIGGNFITYKGLTNRYIIRLNSDGTKDLTFDNSIGFNASVISILLQPDSSLIIGGNFTLFRGYINNRIIKTNSVGGSESVLELGSETYTMAYCPTNDLFYTSPYSTYFNNDINILSGDGKYAITSIPLPLASQNSNSVQYNSNNNCMYFLIQDLVLSQGKILVLDCGSNTFIATINLPSFDNSYALSSPNSANEIYFFDNSSSYLQKIDCNTNTLVLINLSLPNFTGNLSSLSFNSANNQMYCIGNISNYYIDIIDTLTDTYVSSINIPISYNFTTNFSAINPVTNQLFITENDFGTEKKIAIIDCNTNTLNSVQVLSTTLGITFDVIYNSVTDSMYISGSLFSVVTFSATPFFIGGSTNYNTFVNSLNFEPIFVDEIRILTQNQTQLYNQVQFTKIDSNGNQIFFPEFPITKVDSFQAQGNIAGLKLNGLVFDGRTYINQYVINPNQIVSFEIYYKQLDRFSATPTYPIFFKPKVQLKEYIRKDYNNYDVEM